MSVRILLGLAVFLGWGMAQPLPVAATTGFIGDMVRSVGGERVRVTVVVPLGADPHSFEPRPSTLREVSEAGVLFANGLGLEPFLGKIQPQLPKGARTVKLAEGMPDLIRSGEDEPGEYDPHLWLDPAYGVRYVERIRDTLSQLDPAGRDVYRARAQTYLNQIRQADAEVRGCLRSVPTSARKVVSQHGALLYFARAYSITLVGSISNFAGQEKGPQTFARLAQAMNAQGVRTVFTEPQFSPAEAKALAEATGAKVRRIYSDAFDAQVNTYLGLIRWNGRVVCQSFR
ncbi:MAG TPA: metal ABC transporter substrate-binding protein [Meiothermus sp.]|nr:metal ABC transporter substrate-binding protein [Meiothermus sp.]